MEVREWYHVLISEDGFHLDVSPEQRKPWQEDVRWDDIIRVCFKAEDFGVSDGIYVFIKQRAASFAIPTEADGADLLMEELIKRKLFDAELMIEAASASTGVFCWPPEAGIPWAPSDKWSLRSILKRILRTFR